MIMGERVWDQRIRFLFVVAQMMGIDFFVWRSYWKGKFWWWEGFALQLKKKHVGDLLNQVIQAVTFSSPNVGGHVYNLWRGHVNSPSPKGHKLAELPDLVFFVSFPRWYLSWWWENVVLLFFFQALLVRCFVANRATWGAGWAEQLNAHEFIEPNVDTLKLTVWRGFSLEPTWKGCLFSNKIGQTIKIDVQDLLGQWLNGLNFLGWRIFSRENKVQTFFSGSIG